MRLTKYGRIFGTVCASAHKYSPFRKAAQRQLLILDKFQGALEVSWSENASALLCMPEKHSTGEGVGGGHGAQNFDIIQQ